ncbi:(2Fe-2S)-binding protein [Chelatococcus sp. SYSU_G07232]|uniref:(2Fe-2S)-binding protein n=1 Tax=Chelatococcus albus TaxID=3047466 RepID=A0ABT7AFQ7_9HYPH|nr:(2Fe-2S)-binding protein [Chelatococcus sp. SYSU_G07232]MDJ1157930.1 (2Fe-2S)-binding protein [Chelatococcus sp. SYSU_G07232]
MIVCSCNVLSDRQILSTLDSEEAGKPRSPAQAYRCLGCSPDCGRCLVTVRRLLADARGAACDLGCPICPSAPDEVPGEARLAAVISRSEPANVDLQPLMAAE